MVRHRDRWDVRHRRLPKEDRIGIRRRRDVRRRRCPLQDGPDLRHRAEAESACHHALWEDRGVVGWACLRGYGLYRAQASMERYPGRRPERRWHRWPRRCQRPELPERRPGQLRWQGQPRPEPVTAPFVTRGPLRLERRPGLQRAPQPRALRGRGLQAAALVRQRALRGPARLQQRPAPVEVRVPPERVPEPELQQPERPAWEAGSARSRWA